MREVDAEKEALQKEIERKRLAKETAERQFRERQTELARQTKIEEERLAAIKAEVIVFSSFTSLIEGCCSFEQGYLVR